MNPVSRKRGVLLSGEGLQRLRLAIAQTEAVENNGNPYSAEALSERTGVSISTWGRLWSAKKGVDQRSLRLIFSAFGLELTPADLQGNEPILDLPALEGGEPPPAAAMVTAYPCGPVPEGSPLYIPRPPIEERAFQEISQPGCVLRIKGPHGFGKCSLLLRLLERANQLDYASVKVDLKQADPDTLVNPDAFLRWFCVACTLGLGLTVDVDTFWSDLVGWQLSTTLYVRESLLTQTDRPLVLIIKQLDRIFEYPETARSFLPLLRSWHEEARHDRLWQQLRLVVAYATDNYLLMDINYSPFNVGLPLVLPEFTPEQVRSLAAVYQLTWQQQEVAQLMALVGGNPRLVHLALYHLASGLLSLSELLQTASSRAGIYQSHLQPLLVFVQERPAAIAALRTLLMSQATPTLDPRLAYQLAGMGLIKAINGGWQISCGLYRDYFQKYLVVD